jgi:acetyl coenzyme A synthetase (ADP forming)-like protein
VIGASRERGTIGGQIFHNLLAHSFEGPVYPVNPKAATVQSVAAYPAIADVPGPVDLAVIVVPGPHVLPTLEACGKKGVGAAVVISAGFKEVSEEGAAKERELRECARKYGMRIVGPNCLGIVNTEPDVRLNATFATIQPPAGRVAFSSQSGALGQAILEYAENLHVGISHFASVGNKADVSGNDLLEYWEKDPGTGVILLYLESFGNPRRFKEIARRVGRKKPIIAVKSGRTRAGIRATASHTGSLAGADVPVEALFHQAGVIRTDTIEELFDVAMLLATQPVPRGNRVGILTNAGGPGIMATDACESHGLEVPLLDPATVEALRAFLAPQASTRNPVDMIASANPENYVRSLRLLLDDPNLDAVLVIFVPPLLTLSLEVAKAIVRATAAAADASKARGVPPKPVLTCFMGLRGVPEGLRSLQENQIPSYVFPESAAIGLSHAVRYGKWLAEPEGTIVRFDDVRAARGAAAIDAARNRGEKGSAVWLRPEEVREVLAAYGIATPAWKLAATADETARFADEIGFPVAIKLVSDTITHKTEVGGVVLDVRNEVEAWDAFTRIEERMRDLRRHGEMAGVSVQKMVPEGVEAIVGVTQDPAFGPMVMFGLGGVHVEIFKDVVFRIHPLTDRDAREMVRAVRGYGLLGGYRGSPKGDVAGVETALLRVSQLLEDHPEIVEMDLNPMKVLEPGEGCVVVDARISVRNRDTGKKSC